MRITGFVLPLQWRKKEEPEHDGPSKSETHFVIRLKKVVDSASEALLLVIR
jgi:hypothetical protein